MQRRTVNSTASNRMMRVVTKFFRRCASRMRIGASREEGIFVTSLSIGDGPDANNRIVTVLAPQSYFAAASAIGRLAARFQASAAPCCWTIGSLYSSGPAGISPAMHFYRDIEDMPGYTGVGLPPDAIPPSGVVPAEKRGHRYGRAPGASQGARLEHVPQVRITTIPGPGSFSAGVPVKHAGTVAGPCWVVVKLRVRSGRIAFTAFERFKGIIEKTKPIAPSPAPQSVALYVPGFVHTTDIVVFNSGSGSAVVDVFDVAVLAPVLRHVEQCHALLLKILPPGEFSEWDRLNSHQRYHITGRPTVEAINLDKRQRVVPRPPLHPDKRRREKLWPVGYDRPRWPRPPWMVHTGLPHGPAAKLWLSRLSSPSYVELNATASALALSWSSYQKRTGLSRRTISIRCRAMLRVCN